MPLYDYSCQCGHLECEILCGVNDVNEEIGEECPHCGTRMKRKFPMIGGIVVWDYSKENLIADARTNARYCGVPYD